MSFRLAAAGDIVLSSDLKSSKLDILKYVRECDLATANLEVVVSESEMASDKLVCLKISPSHIDTIASLGFTVLNIANNHAFDFGFQGFRDTSKFLTGAGLLAVGGGENLDDSLRPGIVEVTGRRVAIFGASTTLPNGCAAGIHKPGIAPVRVITRYRLDGVTSDEAPGMSPYVETEAVQSDVSLLCDAVRTATSDVDLVIVHLHWGVPLGWTPNFQDEISQYQRPLAHALVEAGASLIIGHHSHALQAVEFYKGSPILYSVGSFMMHPLPGVNVNEGAYPPYRIDLSESWSQLGCVAFVEWQKDIQRPICRFLITRLNEDGEPVLAGKDACLALADRLAARSAPLGTVVEFEPNPDGGFILSFS